jgi:hypothetical protein
LCASKKKDNPLILFIKPFKIILLMTKLFFYNLFLVIIFVQLNELFVLF